MSCIRYPSVVLCSTVALLALLLCGLPPGAALGQDKKPDRALGQGKKPAPAEPAVGLLPVEVHNLQLRYARAYEIANLLEKIFADSRLHVVADERTNSLLLRVSGDKLAEIRELIKKVDRQADDPSQKISVYALRSIEPDEALEAGLRLLFKGTPGNFAVDRARKLVIVSANQATMDVVEAVLAKLEVMQTSRPAGDFQVRVVWLVSFAEETVGADTKTLPLPAPPDDLKEVLPGLAKLGITEPRVAAQFLIRGKPNNQFLATGTGRTGLYGPVAVTVSGQLGDSREAPDMRMVIEVSAPPQRERGPYAKAAKAKKASAAEVVAPALAPEALKEVLSHLETNISAPPGHLVVLGVTPMQSMTSAFVVQVLGEKDRKEATRKK